MKIYLHWAWLVPALIRDVEESKVTHGRVVKVSLLLGYHVEGSLGMRVQISWLYLGEASLMSQHVL